jgi:tricorn protease
MTMKLSHLRPALLALVFALVIPQLSAGGPAGYYRQPTINGSTVAFVAEGDLWKVHVSGGVATRLTSHPGNESRPKISPDGRTVAFVGTYEGPNEVYTMPIDGGRPTRRTFGISAAGIAGWASNTEILISTPSRSPVREWQLAKLNIAADGATGGLSFIPLWQAADGTWDDDGSTLYFTRLAFQGSHTKRYQGGTAQNLWRFADGAEEAEPLTADYPGTSKEPMWWQGRVYFATDRDGSMNLWSMAPDGSDLEQHTRHADFEVKTPSHEGGRIVYQLGADLRLFDIASGSDRQLDITLDTDLDQTRENWVEKPMDYVTTAHISDDGDRVALTARGRVFSVPVKEGRLIDATPADGVRHRDARFLPDGDTILSLSDASGEVELWTMPARGVGEAKQLTEDGTILRWATAPSPDGKWIAHYDKGQKLHLYSVESGVNREVAYNPQASFFDLDWSPDSRWLAYVRAADNTFNQVMVMEAATGESHAVTTDRFDSFDPAWSSDGKWLFINSHRNLRSVVGSPWGNYQPEPFLDKKSKLYGIALQPGLRSPFKAEDEVSAAAKEDKADDAEDSKPATSKKGKKGNDETADDEEDDKLVVEIDFDGIKARLYELPVEPGNYSWLDANEDTLFWTSRQAGQFGNNTLHGLAIKSEKPEVKTIASGIRGFELSGNGKKILLRKGSNLHVIDAKASEAKLDDAKVDLSNWHLSVQPLEEWRQMFVEAWRLERDYFYDPGMHGVDWDDVLHHYMPLVDRVTTRAELSDLIAQMVSEISTLHTFVGGGDMRDGPDDVAVGALGADLTRDAAAGGYRVDRVLTHDPDEPHRAAPLARPTVNVIAGDVIEMINGRSTLEASGLGELLRHSIGQQVLMAVRGTDGTTREVIVEPFSLRAERDLRYHEWELTRRLHVEEASDGDFGYVHLRAMGRNNFTEWAKGYYPKFTAKGLIIDVRYNNGGNIDSWILSRLLRKVWFYWSQHEGKVPGYWNMQQAFRGHLVVLMNESTASDGEAFAEGFRRLGLGELIGTRTWGGEIWLTSSNVLVDRGIATAAEFGVYGPEGEWLIEGWGVEPDIELDNLPHATFNGHDAQLEAAIEHLKQRLAEEPLPDYPTPEYPDLSIDSFNK